MMVAEEALRPGHLRTFSDAGEKTGHLILSVDASRPKCMLLMCTMEHALPFA